MPIVTIDASDALVAPLRGWGRYVAELVAALRAAPPADLTIDVACRSGRLPESFWEQWGLPRHARRIAAAAIHAPNCFLALRRPCAGVVTVHDLAFETDPRDFSRRTGAKYRALVPRAARSAERVICDSQFTAEDVARRYGVDRGAVRVIPLAPALARAAPAAQDATTAAPAPAGDYLIGVGDLRAKKDFATLVRAWRSLRGEGFPHTLVICGVDGGEGARLRALAAREPLTLTGYVDDARLDALLRGAQALVHPSRHEGFGLVLLEAMARGTPVVAARAAALPQTAGDAALYFEPGDDRELLATLRRLLDDPRERAELVTRGIARAAEHTWARTAAATLDVYREVL